MNFNEGYLFENGIVSSKEMNYKTCLIFGKHTISSGDRVCLWTTGDAVIVGEFYKVDGGFVLIKISSGSTVRVDRYEIRGMAKKIDGKWVSMREVKDEP